MARKSQEEMEAPAKVWQVEALNGTIDEVKVLVQTLVAKSDNQVTNKRFEEGLLAQSTAFADKIADEKDKLNLRIDGLSKDVKRNNNNMTKFTWIVIGVGMTIIGSAVSVIYFTQGG